jgi:DnaK suppressor protein
MDKRQLQQYVWKLKGTSQKKLLFLSMENDEIKQKLLDEIGKTEKIIEQYKQLTKPVEPDCAIGRVSRMDAINNKSITEATLRQAEQKLSSLKRVWSMYGTRDFGRCLNCKAQIPAGRILYRPESLYCINCAI